MFIDRKANTKRNVIWGTLRQVLDVLLRFLIRTIVIRMLGAEYLGLSNLFSSILQVLSLAEAGFSSAIVFSMYRPIAEDDTDKICALLAYYRRVYRIIGCIITVGGICVMPFLERIIKGGYPADINLYLLYGIFLFDTAISYFLFSYRQCLLTAHQRNDVYSRIVTTVMLTEYVIQIVMLVVFRNYYLYIVFRPIATVTTNILCGLITRKMYPNYRCAGVLGQADRLIIREKISGLIVAKLSEITRNSFDSVFISAYLGLKAVAVYGNYYYIHYSLIVLLMILLSSIAAGVGNSVAVESKSKNFQDFRKIQFLYHWLFGWCTVCLLCLYQPFMEIWVGREMLASFPVMVIFCVYFYCLSLGGVQSTYTQANGLWWESRKYYVMEAVANIVLNWILVKYLGIFGIVLASVISALLIGNASNLYILYKHYFTEESLRAEWLRRIGNMGIVTAVCAVTYGICRYGTFDNLWLTLFVRACICLVVPNVLFWLIYRKSSIYPAAMQLLASTIGRSRQS